MTPSTKTPEEIAEQKARQRTREKEWRQRNKDRVREYAATYRVRNLEYERERKRQWQKDNPGRQAAWNKAHPESIKASKEKYFSKPENVAKQAEAAKTWRESEKGKKRLVAWHRSHFSIPINRFKRMVNQALSRAKKSNLPFDEDLYEHLIKNIPTHCVCCNGVFDYQVDGHKRLGASLDRIDNNGGYTIANVAVICRRCNDLKKDATADELRLVVAYIERNGRQ
jgi:hypothetical protein